MNKSCFEHSLTKPEQEQYNKDGYILIKNVLNQQQISRSLKAVDKIRKPGFFFKDGIIEEDDVFLELVDNEKVLPKVWEILGWNIYLVHTHLNVTPGHKNDKSAVLWHQDFDVMYKDCKPLPGMFAKVCYFLTDTLEPHMGSLMVVPGSHLSNSDPDFKSTKEILVQAGDVVIFDLRLWHAPGRNRSNKERYAMFYTYGHRWLRPHDVHNDEYLSKIQDPICKQLLGYNASPNAYSYYQPILDDVPLRIFLIKNKRAI